MAAKAGEDVLKKPYQTDSYTEEQLIEFIQCADDPFFFIENFVKVQHPTKGMLPLVLYPFQHDMVNAFWKYRKTIVLTGRQLGKALPLDTPIATPDGWTTMGDIKVGDYVIGDDGLPTMVDFVTDPMFDHTVYEIEFDTGEVIKADAEHIWRIKATRWKKERDCTTEEMIGHFEAAKKRKGSISIPVTKPLELPEANLPIDPYVLGVWIGDGYSAGARICGTADDLSEILSHVESAGYELRETKFDKRNGLAMCCVKDLHVQLREHGLLDNKHIPAAYLRASVDQRLNLLRGLMDTDGYADRNGGCEFFQKNRAIIDQVRELLSSLGIKNRLRSKEIKGETYYTVRFATSSPVFKLARKLEIQQSCTDGHRKNGHHYIRDIRKIASEPVKCIRVTNESHMFLCGRSMVPTHNTTTAAAYLLWHAMFVPDQTILIVANVLRQALEIMHRVRTAYENCPDHIRAGITEYNKSSIAFDNGSRIVAQATTANTGRGMSISLLYVDEMAFCPPNLLEDMMTSLSPTLATGGRAIITSTPKSDADMFAKLWFGANDHVDEYGNAIDHVGRNGYFPVQVTWDSHPDRDQKWADGERATIGEQKFLQEHCCQFLTDDETLIHPLTLAGMRGMTEPMFFTGAVRWYVEPEPNRVYMVALDPSLGTGRDYSAIQIFSLPDMTQVAEWQHNKTDPRGQVRSLLRLLVMLDSELRNHPEQISDPEIYWTVENNSIGEAILQIIEDTGEEKFPGLMVNEKRRAGQSRRFRKGLNTDNRKKLSACARLKSLVESQRMKIHSEQLIKQLKTFVTSGAGFSAKPGTHDDLISATLLVTRMIDTVIMWSDSGEELKEAIGDDELYEDEGMPFVM